MQTSPWKVLSAHVGVGVLTEGWRLDVADPREEGARCHQVEVYFDSPFLSPPVVQLGLTGFDMDQRDSARLTLKAESITSMGFLATVGTWADSRVFAVEFQWLAIGA
jgi:hypothetical protein